MLTFENDTFDYEPYPICYLASVLDQAVYAEMCAAYPPAELFQYKPNLGQKYSLSEVNHGTQYADFIATHPIWRRFHDYVKAPAFIETVFAFLVSRNIDMGLGAFAVNNAKGARFGWATRFANRTELSARFEFSMMGPRGGSIRPHTDGPNKLVTLVISMMAPDEWDERWGGATQVCVPRDRTKIYNQQNRYMDFEDMEIVKTFAFKPNQCVLFIKTYNSWHQVSPIQGVVGAPMRKTITINIERRA